MTYLTKLASPLGPLSLASDAEAVTGLWLEGQKYFAAELEADTEERPDLLLFRQAEAWLDAYFAKWDLPPLPPLAPRGRCGPGTPPGKSGSDGRRWGWGTGSGFRRSGYTAPSRRGSAGQAGRRSTPGPPPAA